MEFEIFVPFDRTVETVYADGLPATLLSTQQNHGSADQMQRWFAPLSEPPMQIVINFRAVGRAPGPDTLLILG